MKALALLLLVLCGCTDSKFPPPKFEYGTDVSVPGFYAACKGVVIGTFEGNRDRIYTVQLDCPKAREYFNERYLESDLSKL